MFLSKSCYLQFNPVRKKNITIFVRMNFNKVLTIIAGVLDDRNFNYACFIAESLSQILPNFNTKKIIISCSDWKDWLEEKCKHCRWSHKDSVLVWRETGFCGGTQIYIGGVLEFKDFVKEHYAIDVGLSISELKSLDLDYSYVISPDVIFGSGSANNSRSKLESEKRLCVTIIGAGRSVCPDLVAQIATMKEISENGIEIYLYDTPGHFFKTKDIVKDAVAIGSELCSISTLENLSDGLKCCDILIILDHIDREDYESSGNWLQKTHDSIKEIAEQINIYASLDLKVIFCSIGPSCFCANVLIKETKLNKDNVVAVSAHYGLEIMYDLVKTLNIDNKEIGCPPVWGFLGINQYVDIYHIIHKYSACIPKKIALKSNENSTHSMGIKSEEFRWLQYLAFNEKPHERLTNRKFLCLYQVGRTEDFQKCKAICDLLKLWFRKSDPGLMDEIISLGISSDGSFGIPKGIYFSQPVQLKILEDNSRIWVPVPEFPVPHDSIITKNGALTAQIILKRMDLMN